MIKRFLKWIGRYIKFDKNFVVSVVDDHINSAKLSTKIKKAVDDKIVRANKEQEGLQNKYTSILHDMLKQFFGRKYNSVLEEQIAFDTINKEWKLLCKKVNSTNKLVRLSKDEFEKQCDIHYKKIKK